MTREQLLARVGGYILSNRASGDVHLSVELEQRSVIVLRLPLSYLMENEVEVIAERIVSFALSDVAGYGRAMTYEVNVAYSHHYERCSLHVLPRRELFLFTMRDRMQSLIDAEIVKKSGEIK